MKINIINFGPIKNAQIEFAKLLIFTGDSNLGKSYVNYLIYYLIQSTSAGYLCTNFPPLLKIGRKTSLEVTIKSFQDFLESQVENFMRKFLNSPDLTCNVKFNCQVNIPDDKFVINYEERKHANNCNQELSFDGFNTVFITINGKHSVYTFLQPRERDPKSFAISREFSKTLQIAIFGSIIDQSFILPPARGAFVGENYTLKYRVASSVGMYRDFLADYDRSTIPHIRGKHKTNNYTALIETLINGRLVSHETIQYLQLKTGKELPLSAAASSIKELSPLLYALQANPDAHMSFCLEEPEAHLHPQMQIAAVDLIANCYSNGTIFQFTTHSDYVLQRINQLIKLYYIKEHNQQDFSSLAMKYNLTEKHCIKPQDVKMYYFNLNEAEQVVISDLPIDKYGLPMVTFFEVIKRMNRIEDDFDNAIEGAQKMDR